MNDQAIASREDPRDIETEAAAQLERLRGVLAAAVWVGQHPTVREVYIAAAPDVSVPDLKETIRAVLRDNGLVCPPDAIHIGVLDAAPESGAGREPPAEPARPASAAEPAPASAAGPGGPAPEPPAEEAEVPPPWHGRFLILSALEVRRAGNEVTCRVQLLRVGEPLTGEATEIDTPAGRARAGTALSLEGAAVLDLFNRKYVAVSVEAATARRTTLLSGLVPIDRSIEDAACLATLGAIERWLAW